MDLQIVLSAPPPPLFFDDFLSFLFPIKKERKEGRNVVKKIKKIIVN